MIRTLLRLFPLAILVLFSHAKAAAPEASVVKIYTTARIPSHYTPWQGTVKRITGSGVVIPGRRILTNAHMVAYHTYIEVQRHGSQRRWVARVEAVDHGLDLALLRVVEPGFFDGVPALELGPLPRLRQHISVYGYPKGGRTLSVSDGVVSRIEHGSYTHSERSFLRIQIDAAINPGNSGGPALSDGRIVGIVMGGYPKAQNLGYLVPAEMIRHFLDDVRDGHVDGVPEPGIVTQPLRSPDLKSYYGLSGKHTGILVYKILPQSGAEGVLRPGDILLAIDGHSITDDEKVEFRPGEFTSFLYYAQHRQMNESVPVTIRREGKTLELQMPLTGEPNGFALVPLRRFESHPRYTMLGGFLFAPLTRKLVFVENHYNGDYCGDMMALATKDRRERVVLLRILDDISTRGYYKLKTPWPIEKIDGKPLRDFRQFVRLLGESKGRFVVLEDARGQKVVIDRQRARKAQGRIEKRYGIVTR